MRKPDADCPWCEGIGVIEFPGIRIDCQCCHPNVPTQALRDLYAQYKDRAGPDPVAQARAEGERAGRIAMRGEAAKIASEYNCWDYVAKKPDGSWGPGSPYDRGQLNAAQMIAAGIMLLKVEGEAP